jgi:erythronate-4-phosphate dehydrogenase
VKIVADRNIPFVEEAFASFGDVRVMPGSAITAEALRDAELLLCRSTIQVGPALLEGSQVRFVATATIGTDHLDLTWLAQRGIAWASAPGSNADSVVQWFAAALLHLGLDLGRTRIGVVGAGNVGRRIARLAAQLSEVTTAPPPLVCDPPRARAEGAGGFVSLEDLLDGSDLVTLHVPLERSGPDATLGMIDGARLGRLRDGAVLVNASRGEVIDQAAVLAGRARLKALVLDVFPGEPRPAAELVAACTLATPHIAGHSLDGKICGTRMIYAAACRFLGVAPTWVPHPPAADPPDLELDAALPERELLLRALAARYDITRDDAALRAMGGDDGSAFSRYRATYPVRREISALNLKVSGHSSDLVRRLRTIC